MPNFRKILNRNVAVNLDGHTSVVQPQFAKFCGVADIISRCLHGDRSGLRSGGVYGDFTVVPSTLQDALNQQIRARDSYLALPPAVRRRYPTPESFFMACHSPDQIEALKALGLCNPSVSSSTLVAKTTANDDNKPVNTSTEAK